jgi:hypothetical protein
VAVSYRSHLEETVAMLRFETLVIAVYEMVATFVACWMTQRRR